MPLKAEIDEELVNVYPELESCRVLRIQLEIFQSNANATNLHEAKLHYRSIKPEVRALFPLVATLMKPFLVCLVISCECERSFPTLCRLKT